MTSSSKAWLWLAACSCLGACQEPVTAVAPAPPKTPINVVSTSTEQAQQIIMDKIDAAQQVNQQRLDAAENF